MKWYGLVRRGEEHCSGRRVMEMEVQRRRKRGRHRRIWLSRVRDDIKEKDCRGRRRTTVLHEGVMKTCRGPIVKHRPYV